MSLKKLVTETHDQFKHSSYNTILSEFHSMETQLNTFLIIEQRQICF